MKTIDSGGPIEERLVSCVEHMGDHWDQCSGPMVIFDKLSTEISNVGVYRLCILHLQCL